MKKIIVNTITVLFIIVGVSFADINDSSLVVQHKFDTETAGVADQTDYINWAKGMIMDDMNSTSGHKGLGAIFDGTSIQFNQYFIDEVGDNWALSFVMVQDDFPDMPGVTAERNAEDLDGVDISFVINTTSTMWTLYTNGVVAYEGNIIHVQGVDTKNSILQMVFGSFGIGVIDEIRGYNTTKSTNDIEQIMLEDCPSCIAFEAEETPETPEAAVEMLRDANTEVPIDIESAVEEAKKAACFISNLR